MVWKGWRELMVKKSEQVEEAPGVEMSKVAKGKPLEAKLKISASLDVGGIQSVLAQVYNDGKLSGFRDGVKYIVTLAENFLVEHEKLGSREALAKDSSCLPTWWIATLIRALDYEPSYSPMPEKSRKIKQGSQISWLRNWKRDKSERS
jgi:hypothetical protein